MIAALVALVVCSALFGAAAPAVARWAPAATATWVLSLGGVAVAAATTAGLGVTALLGLGRVPLLAHLAGYAAGGIAARSPVPTAVAAGAAAVLTALAARGLLQVRADVRALRSAWATARTSPGLLVLDGRDAVAVPGRPGTVVVGRQLLCELDGDGRRALLAHEHAHLHEHHELHLVAASVAAAANPLLRRLPAAMRTACERQADEVAARATGDRALVADTIARVAAPPTQGLLLGGGGADVPRRVTALLEPRPVRRVAVVPVLLVAASYACLLWLGHGLDSVLDASHLIGAR